MKVTIPVSKKEYEIIDTMTRREVKEAGEIMKPFIGFQERVAKATPEELQLLTTEIQNREPTVDAFMFKLFNKYAGVSKEYFENDMRNIEAIILFNAIWRASTEIPLEYAKQSASS